MSQIDGMISECSSEVGRLARDITEMQGKLSESEAMLKVIEDSHSAKVSKLEVQIGELERDLGKTASSLLKEKKARKTKSSGEAKDALRVEFETRLAKISDFLGSLEGIRRRDLALATIDGGMAVVQALQGETPSSLQAEEARLSACKEDLAAVDGSFDLVLADLKSECFLPTCSEDLEGQDPVVGENRGGAAPSLDEVMGEGEPSESMPPPTRKEIVLALRAPSATPAVPARIQKKRCTTSNNGEPSHLEGSSLASRLHGKFMSLIDGMISECSS
ncbi:hypothetical protein DY000_02059989 [Brassica cretica]|uniref:Uncharacterized protein n=1 Tax=Brassica cretica TaxID=69181 RepID=A0ABQ7B0W8_BRACR|nr:hypothetical protein DY000_02059989 [Brassica cretica]